jgi:hypothetical protein
MAEFYVKSLSGKLVPAEFLRDRSQPILDSNIAKAKAITLYDADGTVAGKNTEGHLIVPEERTLESIQQFGAAVRNSPGFMSYPVMIGAFVRGGTL